MVGAQFLRRISAAAAAAFLLVALPAMSAPAPKPSGLPISKVIPTRAPVAKAGVCTLPTPVISASPSPITLPTTLQDLTSTPVPVTISNNGTGNLQVQATATFNPPGCDCPQIFQFTGCSGVTIPPGGSCTASATFLGYGGTGQVLAGTVEIYSNDPVTPTLVVPISGTVGTASLAASPSFVDFGGTPASPPTPVARAVTLTNAGTVLLTVNGLSPGGTDIAAFAIANGTCPAGFPFSLAAGASCNLSVTFTPASPGTYDSAYFFANYTAGTLNTSTFVSLRGVGTTTGGAFSFSPASVDFFSWAPDQVTYDVFVTATNLDVAPHTVSSVAVANALPVGLPTPFVINDGGAGCTAAAIPPGGSCVIPVSADTTGLPAGAYSAEIAFTSDAGPSLVPLAITVIPAVPNLAWNPSFASFPDTLIGAQSVVTYTLENADPVSYSLSGVQVTGAAHTLATPPGTCVTNGVIPAAGASVGTCTVNVLFSPLAAATYFMSLSVTEVSTGNTFSASGSGRGVNPGPRIGLSPGAVSFPVGTQGSAVQQVVTATNIGNAATPTGLAFVSNHPDVSAVAGTCATALGVGASCTFTVIYNRASIGSLPPAQVTVQGTEATPTFYNQLDVFGDTVAVVPAALEAFPLALAFPATVLGTASAPLEISVGNTGGLPLDIGSIVSSAPGEFAVVSTCPIFPAGTVAPGACCLLTVTFTPAAAGARAATITMSNAQGVPLGTISLSGIGQSPTAPGITKSFSPNPIQAGGVSTLTISITNPNVFALTNASFTDAFPSGLVVAPTPALTNTCSGTVTAAAGGASLSLSGGTIPAAGASIGACAVSVQVTAASASPGLVNTIPPGASPGGLVTTQSNGAPSASATLVVNSLPSPSVVLSPTSLAFGTQTVFVATAPQTVTVQNVGNANLNVSSVTVSGDFSVQSACTASPVPPAGQCTIDASFTPITTGLRTGQVAVASDAPGSPHLAALSGTGVVPPSPNVSLSPTSVAFPTTTAGQVSAPQVVTLTNTGGAPLSVLAVDLVGAGFTRTHNCGNVASLASCQIQVVFAPPSAGSFNTTLRIASDAPGSPHFVPLTGSAAAAPSGRLTASPASLSFNDQIINTASAPRGFTITNAGSATLSISRISVTGDFALEGLCFDLRVGESCAFRVTFLPTAVGLRAGQVVVESDASNAVFGIALSGRGVPVPAPIVSLSATSLGYGNMALGAASVLPLTITNSGSADLLITSIVATGDYRVAGSCTAVMPPGATCRLDVTFAPSIPGPRAGELRVFSNAPLNPVVATLSGTGCRLFSFVGGRSGAVACGP